MRPVVVDTNVVVAGLLTANREAPMARILDAMLRGALSYLLSPSLLAEYRRVLLRPAIARRHRLLEPALDDLLAAIALSAMVREPPVTDRAPDLGDQHLWDLLAEHPGACLVTGDDLLRERAGNRAVITPAELVERLSL